MPLHRSAAYGDAGQPLLCASGYAARMSGLSAVATRAVLTEYRIPPSQRRSYQLDRLVPIELGGSNALANLDPERGSPSPGYRQKDRLEKQLHTLVCAGKL